MLLFAGLGNPGAKYANNRHNIGFMAIDYWLKSLGHNGNLREEHKALTQKFKLKDREVLVAKPQTFMNKSEIRIFVTFEKRKQKPIIAFSKPLFIIS